MLAAQVLVCLSVGSSVGSSADVGCTGTCVPIDWGQVLEVQRMWDAQVFVCLPVSWVEGLEVLAMSGAHTVCEYHLPFRNVRCTDTPVSISWLDVSGEICC